MPSHPASDSATPPEVVPRAVTGLVVAGAILLGLINANVSLKADDVGSLHAVLAPWPDLIGNLSKDVHPPLYFFFLKAFVSALGDGEWALRVFSIVCYWLGGAAMYRLARRFLPPAGAIQAAAVFLTAPLAVLSAELVRMYSMTGLLGILAATTLVDFVRRPGWRGMAAFTGWTVLGTFTHIWFFCLLAGLGLAVLLRAPALLWRVALGMAAGLVPYALFWLPMLWRQLELSSEAMAWLPAPDLDMLTQTVLLWLGVSVLLLPWVIWRWRRLSAKGPEDGREAAAWALWILVGCILPAIAVSFYKPFFYPRFTLVAIPFVALLVGWALWRTAGVQSAGALVILACLMALGLRAYPENCTGRVAARQLLEHARPGDFVIFTGLSRPAARHYLDRTRPGRNWQEQTFPAEIDTHPGYEGRVGAPARLPGLRREAAALADRLRQSPPGTQLFFLEGRFPDVEAILKQALSAPASGATAASLQPFPVAACPADGGGYFHTISGWRVP